MEMLPFEVHKELEGWTLFWAHLECVRPDPSTLEDLRGKMARTARDHLTLEGLSQQPTVAALRKLFRAAGCDPTRYRPASEALLRRILKGDELPAIHPLVDINNCLSLQLAVPCCVMREGSFEPPIVLRSGLAGESYRSLRGPFNLEGKPLLVDSSGPLDAPITGSERVKITPETTKAWMVAYLPAVSISPEQAQEKLYQLLEAAPMVQAQRIAAV